MLNAQLTVPQWLSLPIVTRTKIVKIFNLPRSSGALVQDNKVVSDGYTHDDLAHITVGRLQAEIGNDKEMDFYKLFQMFIESLEPKAAPPEPEPEKHPLSKLGLMIPWLGEVPKDFVLNIGGTEYVLVPKKERLGVVASDDKLKADKPKRKYAKQRGRPRKQR